MQRRELRVSVFNAALQGLIASGNWTLGSEAVTGMPGYVKMARKFMDEADNQGVFR